MDSHNDLLGELAADAALERSDFIVQSTEQLRRFLDHHKERIAVLGGLTLIDDEPDYLAIAPDLSFRSRSRYIDDLTGEWVSETEVIESASELIELYNPADIYAAFAESAREAAGMPAEPTAEGDLLEVSGISPEEGISLGEDPYAAAADSWAAGQPVSLTEDDDESAARRLYDLALEFQERSQRSEARLLDEFEGASGGLVAVIGDMIIVDDDDERLSLTTSGFRAEVIPEDAEDEWRTLSGPDELVEFYDPTDVFGDLADALAEAFPRSRRRWPGAIPTAPGRPAPRRPPRLAPMTWRPRTTRTPTTPRTSPRRDDAARGRGAGRQSGDPAGPVDPGVPRPGSRQRLPGRAVRPRQARRFLRDDPAAAVLAQHGGSRDRDRDHPLPGHRPGDRLVHAPSPGRRDRPPWTARTAVRGGSAERGTSCWSQAGSGWPASGCSPTRRSGTDAG